ncbi:MAG TPA: hypothetical protein VK988_04325 [Acidimicrobiales bacterium]|nr:hypothetical protein [Acidimicrobiales bacterium]
MVWAPPGSVKVVPGGGVDEHGAPVVVDEGHGKRGSVRVSVGMVEAQGLSAVPRSNTTPVLRPRRLHTAAKRPSGDATSSGLADPLST